MEEWSVHDILKVLGELEHPYRPPRLAIREAEPIPLGLADSLRSIEVERNVLPKRKGALPTRVHPLAVLGVQLGVVYTCASDCEHDVRALLQSVGLPISLYVPGVDRCDESGISRHVDYDEDCMNQLRKSGSGCMESKGRKEGQSSGSREWAGNLKAESSSPEEI